MLVICNSGYYTPKPNVVPNNMPIYGLPLGFMPPITTQAPISIGNISAVHQNLLYNQMIMPNVPQAGLHMAQVGPSTGAGVGLSVTNARGPIFPNMPWSMPYNTPSNAFDSFAMFRQQIDESHHDLANMLTQQITIVLNPLIKLNNAWYEQLVWQVNRIAGIMNLEGPQNINGQPIPPHEDNLPNHDIHILDKGIMLIMLFNNLDKTT